MKPSTLVLPELALADESSGVGRRGLILILGGTAVFCVLVAVAVFALLGHQEKTARHGTERFASALVSGNPAAAPEGADGYVRGIRAHFGPVLATRVIGAHNHSVNTGDSADTRSYFVTELLLQTRRGPAVVEVDFDNHSLSSDAVSSVRELSPNDAPGLAPSARRALDAAFAARGGHAASAAALSGASTPAAPAATRPAVAVDPKLRCVQAAHGDVGKLQRCG
jgi:hypothetical protein